MGSRDQAILIVQPRPAARLRLVCFSYAGAGANVFRDWDLGEAVEIAAVQLPGREWRRHERALRQMDAVIDDLMPAVEDCLAHARPTVFFGYSMGAAVGYALASRLLARNGVTPAALFVAACRAPQLLRKMTPIYTLDDDDFVAAIRRFGGMPDAILNEPDLMEFALPVLRADFEVLGTYQHKEQAPLCTPVFAYGGCHDPHASRSELSAWRTVTADDFRLRLFSGGHFFINETRAQLLRTLAADLAAFHAP